MKGMMGAATAALWLWSAVTTSAQAQAPQDRIDAALAKARQAGIPEATLTNKVAEGKAKGVSLDRIALVIERREATLERANRALSGQEDIGEPDLVVAADALESNVSEAVLKAVAEHAPRDRRAVAIAALTELVELNYSSNQALQRVLEALKQGPTALLNLPAAARRRGAPSSVQLPDAATGRQSGPASPPLSVPAPGKSPQANSPNGGPATGPSGTVRGTGRAGGA